MTRAMVCNMRGLALASCAQLLFIAAQPATAGQRVLNERSRERAGTGRADRKDSLTLGFNLTKDSDGGVWAHFYIWNRGRSGLLICDAMRLSFSVSDAENEATFPLFDVAYDANPTAFFLLDGAPPKRGMSGCSVLSRRVRVPGIFLRQLAGLQELVPERMNTSKFIGHVEGSILKWKAGSGEYVKIPFHICSQPDSWEQFSQFFAGFLPSEEEVLEEFTVVPSGEMKVSPKRMLKRGSE